MSARTYVERNAISIHEKYIVAPRTSFNQWRCSIPVTTGPTFKER